MENNNFNDWGFSGNSNPNNWNYDPVTGQPLNRNGSNPYQNNGPMPEHVYKDMIKQQKKMYDNNSKECKYLCFASLACWLVSNFFFFFENQIQSCLKMG
ncbi:hypothetical protein [Butyrivibrio sp. VCD2006]|uniref:hypothetical protein n=1 Tax=Butyrivibrio sp. VCD2006 TaxID=1280664 RepID=UPI00041A98CD|nr:hypothetical protein [Butyrivibrio sp. VCD2006]